MNILILSASTGGGHMKTSNSIKSYIEDKDKTINIKVIDSLLYINPILNKTVTNGYIYLATKIPKLYGVIYDLSNRETRFSNFVSKLNSSFSERLLPLIEESIPDIIITTHPFPTEMISILKDKGLVDIPLLCIMTDYAPHKTWINKKVDAYVVSNDDMLEKMKCDGVAEESIYSYGIPISEEFFQYSDKIRIFKDQSLNPNLPTILMMAGSFGVNTILETYKNILEIDKDFQIIVVSGKNKKLYNQFEKIINNKTKLVYYTDKISELMQISDLVITKPGGLTITEALACNIPMLLFEAIPGQEEENANFLIKHKMAKKLEDKNSCIKAISELLEDKNKLINMKIACEGFDKKECSENIFSLIKKLISSNSKNCVS